MRSRLEAVRVQLPALVADIPFARAVDALLDGRLPRELCVRVRLVEQLVCDGSIDWEFLPLIPVPGVLRLLESLAPRLHGSCFKRRGKSESQASSLGLWSWSTYYGNDSGYPLSTCAKGELHHERRIDPDPDGRVL